ncbi:extracellular solute-binding protein [Tomitella gaofuii]|uniref:extracellular solute-binding protein n=1 Tax=Tomitella gaofuii TaxID=2760083 RepID=UPI0015FB1D6F|nr:extracellular solute-binding protein [Tomitella gaofuii]
MSISIKHRRSVRLLAAAAAATAVLGLASCSSGGDGAVGGDSANDADAPNATLTLYSGQHEELAKALAAGFEKDTGIKIDVRAGKDAEMVNQIIEEGDKSKADLIITEEPGPIAELDSKGLLEPVTKEALAEPDQRFVPSTGDWLPWAARSRVYFYDPALISEDQLPDSILDLENPEWKGRFAYAPSGAFVSTTTYLINTIGKDRTLEWLKAIKENGVNERSNGKVRDSVEAGQHEFGLSNHYYWYILAKQKGGEQNLTSRVHFLNNDDAGALMLASGAGVLKSSAHKEEGQRFLTWLASADGGQKIVAEDSPQFPLAAGVTSSYGLPSIDSLTFPEFDQGSLEDVGAAKDLLKQAGIV